MQSATATAIKSAVDSGRPLPTVAREHGITERTARMLIDLLAQHPATIAAVDRGDLALADAVVGSDRGWQEIQRCLFSDDLRRVCRRFARGDDDFAEEIMATVAARAWERRAQYRQGTKAGAWLATMAFNEATSALRKAARVRVTSYTEAQSFDEDEATPIDAADHPSAAATVGSWSWRSMSLDPDAAIDRDRLRTRTADVFELLTAAQQRAVLTGADVIDGRRDCAGHRARAFLREAVL